MTRRPAAAIAAAAIAALILSLATACGGGAPTTAPPARPTASTAATTASITASTRAAAATTTTPAPAWQARAAAPTARQEVGAAVADAKVWVVGGLTAAGASAKVEAYDPATNQWAPGPDLPVALHHPAAATYRGEVVVAGGFLSAADLYSRPSDRVFALRKGAWVELARLARPRGAAAAAAVGDRLVVVGGRDASRLIAPTEVFDGSSWHDAAPIPSPRDHLAAASDGQAVFAVGGRRLDPNARSQVLDRYDPGTDAWETLAPMPTGRGGLGVALVGARLVAVGGEDSSRTFAEVEAYDLKGGTWSSLPPSPAPRHGLAVAATGHTLVALAGGTKAGVAPSDVAEALSPL